MFQTRISFSHWYTNVFSSGTFLKPRVDCDVVQLSPLISPLTFSVRLSERNVGVVCIGFESTLHCRRSGCTTMGNVVYVLSEIITFFLLMFFFLCFLWNTL